MNEIIYMWSIRVGKGNLKSLILIKGVEQYFPLNENPWPYYQVSTNDSGLSKGKCIKARNFAWEELIQFLSFLLINNLSDKYTYFHRNGSTSKLLNA